MVSRSSSFMKEEEGAPCEPSRTAVLYLTRSLEFSYVLLHLVTSCHLIDYSIEIKGTGPLSLELGPTRQRGSTKESRHVDMIFWLIVLNDGQRHRHLCVSCYHVVSVYVCICICGANGGLTYSPQLLGLSDCG